jgi:hypothetical protein
MFCSSLGQYFRLHRTQREALPLAPSISERRSMKNIMTKKPAEEKRIICYPIVEFFEHRMAC